MAPQSPSSNSSFLPNFRLRRPPWETRNATPTAQTPLNQVIDDGGILGDGMQEHEGELEDDEEHGDGGDSDQGQDGPDGENHEEEEEEEDDEDEEEGAIEEGVYISF